MKKDEVKRNPHFHTRNKLITIIFSRHFVYTNSDEIFSFFTKLNSINFSFSGYETF